MAATTPICDFGWKPPDFDLPGVDGRRYTLADVRGPNGLLVMFICNHCPYVKHLRTQLADLTARYLDKGVGIVGINSNDVASYPDDSPEKMRVEAKSVGYRFPYLLDDTQEVAKSYTAACTPDFFLFDADHRLVYRGQFDSSRPGNNLTITGADLAAALDAVVAGKKPKSEQAPSLGCNIKWKAGNAPAYFG